MSVAPFFEALARDGRNRQHYADALLQEIQSWRAALARNLSLRNRHLSEGELNGAVQRIIAGLVFLRMSEDRGIEPFGSLQGLLDRPDVYPQLLELFDRAGEKYHSGLCRFQREKGREPPDELTTALSVDDEVLKSILARLYNPQRPHLFAQLPPDILGQVYEQFLGKVIRLTAGHRAKVEEKPQIRKAGGVYYTPTPIVEYIVANTVGRLVEGKTPQEAGGLTEAFRPSKTRRPLAVLDPACGSGSFLLVAYQFLLDWYLKQYTENDDPQRHARGAGPRIYQFRNGAWRLTAAERKRILLAHIYGVDIDFQAVEVTKLSLLLKVLEGETEQSLERQRTLFHKDRALPDLAENIKCGNSLVGPDYYDRSAPLLGPGGDDRINAFPWEDEFAEVLGAGGFHAVIGNPPWGQKAIGDDESLKRYVRSRYPSAAGIYDLFRPFVERGVTLLDRGGWFGMVLPDIVLLKDYAQTRRFLLDHLSLHAIDWWGMAFSDAVIDAATIVGCRAPQPPDHQVRVGLHDAEQSFSHRIPQADFAANPRYAFNLFLTAEKRQVLERLAAFPRLGDCFEVHEGVHSGNIRKELFVDSAVDATCAELLFGRDEIAPYRLAWKGRFLRLGAVPAKKTPRRYANVGRREWHLRPKVLVRRTGDYVLAAVDARGRFASNNFFLVFPKRPCPLDLDGLCALLNSRFMTWYFRTIEPRCGRVFAELKIKHLATFPLPQDVEHHPACRELNRLGAERAALAEAAAGPQPSPDEHTRIERACTALDRQIDRAVAGAFGLSCPDGTSLFTKRSAAKKT